MLLLVDKVICCCHVLLQLLLSVCSLLLLLFSFVAFGVRRRRWRLSFAVVGCGLSCLCLFGVDAWCCYLNLLWWFVLRCLQHCSCWLSLLLL